MDLPKICKLNPYIVSKVWGGNKLKSFKKITEDIDSIGETWEVSILKEGPAYYNGVSLAQYIPETEIPYLVKFIDTSDNLSIQVHPGDDYAKKHENSFGKTECWLILDAEKDAKIYLGFSEDKSRESFKTSIENKEKINKELNCIDVKRGDFFFVPSGTIHAIGKGVTLIEVQQSSGVTYRVWDWDRLGMDGVPRELHVNKALDVIDFKQHESRHIKKGILNIDKLGIYQMATHSHFDFSLIVLEKETEEVISLRKNNRVDSFICLEGEGVVSIGGEKFPFIKGDTFIYPHGNNEELIIKGFELTKVAHVS